jgi:hypothetical protein
MPEHERKLRLGQVAVDDVEIGAADAAGEDANGDLARPGLRLWHVAQLERLALPGEDHCPHIHSLARRSVRRPQDHDLGG